MAKLSPHVPARRKAAFGLGVAFVEDTDHEGDGKQERQADQGKHGARLAGVLWMGRVRTADAARVARAGR